MVNEVKFIDMGAVKKVITAIIQGLVTDGAHHKQYFLEEAFRALCEDEYVDKAKGKFQWEDGIIP